MKEVRQQKKSFLEKLFSQWPGFLGLLCIAAALGYVWYAKTYPPHRIYLRPVELLIAVGMVSLGYWAFSS